MTAPATKRQRADENGSALAVKVEQGDEGNAIPAPTTQPSQASTPSASVAQKPTLKMVIENKEHVLQSLLQAKESLQSEAKHLEDHGAYTDFGRPGTRRKSGDPAGMSLTPRAGAGPPASPRSSAIKRSSSPPPAKLAASGPMSASKSGSQGDKKAASTVAGAPKSAGSSSPSISVPVDSKGAQLLQSGRADSSNGGQSTSTAGTPRKKIQLKFSASPSAAGTGATVGASKPVSSSSAPVAAAGTSGHPSAGSKRAGVAGPAAADQELAQLMSRKKRIMGRVAVLESKGSSLQKARPRWPEPVRNKSHWDFLLEEMAWLSTDFARERKWKMSLAKKTAHAVAKWHAQKEAKARNASKRREDGIRKTASMIAREVMRFWSQVDKLVQHRRALQDEEEQRRKRSQHLDLLVNKTEQFSKLIAADMQGADTSEAGLEASGALNDRKTVDSKNDVESDEDVDEFESEGDEDDEATLQEQEDGELKEDNEKERDELAEEADMDIDSLLAKYGLSRPEQEADNDAMETDETVSSAAKAKKPAEDDTEEKLQQSKISEFAQSAAAFQPKGFTLDSTEVNTPVPELLNGTLREYQHVAVDWLASLAEKRLNGILADEMGLGKTVMTISTLAHFACQNGIWGPHLVIVPTSVMLNWEIEFKRWAPGFKVITYWGSVKERKQKRKGWKKPNSFHVCITSYKLAVTDASIFKRKKWKYLILDEAHNIKNFNTQRWQVLLNFRAKRRLLITGTPLQNNVMELWSLLHFLMPHVFSSHDEFKDWFSVPLTDMVQGNTEINTKLVQRLHSILRPFVLRRLKSQVEKQMPNKYEHVISCRLSKRQRQLYDEFMESAATKAKLSKGNLLEVINVLMQLRKVCNHPDLFEERPIVSPVETGSLDIAMPSGVPSMCSLGPWDFHAQQSLFYIWPTTVAPSCLVPKLPVHEGETAADCMQTDGVNADGLSYKPDSEAAKTNQGLAAWLCALHATVRQEKEARYASNAQSNVRKLGITPMISVQTIGALTMEPKAVQRCLSADAERDWTTFSRPLRNLVQSHVQRANQASEIARTFCCFMVKTKARPAHITGASDSRRGECNAVSSSQSPLLPTALGALSMFRSVAIRRELSFPDKRLLQYDCGKLQVLDKLLRQLKEGGHRVLIFTQMSKMLDVLEAFLNFHGHAYVRLDGATRVDKRQQLVERFNQDKRLFVFISSTRSGGFGINLTGADTVVFYDSDWNPAMDKQAQDRCHRIGQTRDVHIYRLISTSTVEENILKKADQKRHLDDLVMQSGGFTEHSLSKIDVRDFFTDDEVQSGGLSTRSSQPISATEWQDATARAEDVGDVAALQVAQQEQALDDSEFQETKITEKAPGLEGSQTAAAEAAAKPSMVEEFDQELASSLTAVQLFAVRVVAGQQDGRPGEENEWLSSLAQAKGLESGRLSAPQGEEGGQPTQKATITDKRESLDKANTDDDEELLFHEAPSGESAAKYREVLRERKLEGLSHDFSSVYLPPSPQQDSTGGYQLALQRFGSDSLRDVSQAGGTLGRVRRRELVEEQKKGAPAPVPAAAAKTQPKVAAKGKTSASVSKSAAKVPAGRNVKNIGSAGTNASSLLSAAAQPVSTISELEARRQAELRAKRGHRNLPVTRWTKAEENFILSAVREHGLSCWRFIADMLNASPISMGRRRSAKAVNEYWVTYLHHPFRICLDQGHALPPPDPEAPSDQPILPGEFKHRAAVVSAFERRRKQQDEARRNSQQYRLQQQRQLALAAARAQGSKTLGGKGGKGAMLAARVQAAGGKGAKGVMKTFGGKGTMAPAAAAAVSASLSSSGLTSSSVSGMTSSTQAMVNTSAGTAAVPASSAAGISQRPVIGAKGVPPGRQIPPQYAATQPTPSTWSMAATPTQPAGAAPSVTTAPTGGKSTATATPAIGAPQANSRPMLQYAPKGLGKGPAGAIPSNAPVSGTVPPSITPAASVAASVTSTPVSVTTEPAAAVARTIPPAISTGMAVNSPIDSAAGTPVGASPARPISVAANGPQVQLPAEHDSFRRAAQLARKPDGALLGPAEIASRLRKEMESKAAEPPKQPPISGQATGSKPAAAMSMMPPAHGARVSTPLAGSLVTSVPPARPVAGGKSVPAHRMQTIAHQSLSQGVSQTNPLQTSATTSAVGSISRVPSTGAPQVQQGRYIAQPSASTQGLSSSAPVISPTAGPTNPASMSTGSITSSVFASSQGISTAVVPPNKPSATSLASSQPLSTASTGSTLTSQTLTPIALNSSSKQTLPGTGNPANVTRGPKGAPPSS